MGNTFYFEFEPILIEWLQETLGNIGASLFSFLTFFGESGVIVGIIAVFYLGFDKELGKAVGINAACAAAWNPLIKNIALRRRPYFDHPGIKCLKPVSQGDIYDISAQGYSFPSGHSMSSAAAYGSLGAHMGETEGKGSGAWLVGLILPLLIAASRVVLGIHYPTDVIFGLLAGWGIAFGVSFLGRKIKSEGLFHLILILVTLPGVFYCHTEDYYSALGVMIGFFLAIHFDEKYVNFAPTKSPGKLILRLVLAGVIFFGLNTLLKMPFDEAFLHEDNSLAFLIRTIRYAIDIFVVMGIYPMAFRFKILG